VGGHELDGDGGAYQQRGAQQLRRDRELAEHDGGEQGGGEGLEQRQDRGLGRPDAAQAAQEQQGGDRAGQGADRRIRRIPASTPDRGRVARKPPSTAAPVRARQNPNVSGSRPCR
jgi:hypothetical protein